jgi:hypothetical protein
VAPDDGKDEVGGSDAVPAPAQVSARVDALIDRGLERYGEGDLPGALGEWEHALALDPHALRARDYVDYVRANFELLDEQFRAAKDAAAKAVAQGVPAPDDRQQHDRDDISGAYDLVELQRDSTTPIGSTPPTPPTPTPPRAPPPPPPKSKHSAVPATVDEGWELDDLAAPLPPPPASVKPSAPPSALDDDLASVTAGLEAIEKAPPPPAAPIVESATLELGDATPAPAEAALELGDDDATRAHGPRVAAPTAPTSDDEITVPGGESPPPLPERPALSDEAIASLGGKTPAASIAPRTATGTNPGTSPGTSPGELPAPPHVATPSELVIELGSLDSAVTDDRAPRATDPPPPAEDDEEQVTILKPGAAIGQPVSAAELGLDEETGEATSPAGRRRAMGLVPEDEGVTRPADRTGFAEEAPTIERQALRPIDDDFPEMELSTGGPSSDFEDSPATQERTTSRSPFVGDQITGATAAAQGTSPPGEKLAAGPSVLVDEDLLRPQRSTAATQPIPQARPEPSRDEEEIRKRVNDLLRLAREAADRGDHVAAVEAAERAALEDPEGVVAPVVLHRHRDLLYRIYEGHIGEMTQVPLVAIPLHSIAGERLDHKAGFLLSRVDGMLSFEDILDVAGMPRLDAYRIISVLLRRGIIEVR